MTAERDDRDVGHVIGHSLDVGESASARVDDLEGLLAAADRFRFGTYIALRHANDSDQWRVYDCKLQMPVFGADGWLMSRDEAIALARKWAAFDARQKGGAR